MAAGSPELSAIDAEYFSSYDSLNVHKLMLDDKPRTLAYQKALSPEVVQGKVVLDVGCGTGILSLFAARAGASKVYAVEASNMAEVARILVAQNGLEDIVTVINGRVEDIELPTKVDVIVSEWMGFYLLHESMLASVVSARERFLAPGGLVLPNVCRILTSAVSCQEWYTEEVGAWENMYGFDFSPMMGGAWAAHTGGPLLRCMPESEVLTTPELVVEFDCTTVTMDQLHSFSKNVVTHHNRAGEMRGIALWWDTAFSAELVLDTSPSSPPTHWKQTIILLPDTYSVDKGEELSYNVSLGASDSNPRHYDLSISFS